MKLKDNSTQEIDTALYQLEQRLKSNIRLTDVENSNASTAKINAVDKKLTEEVKDRQSADGKLQDNINKEIADRQEADAVIENAKQDKLIAGDNIQINGNIISATSKEYTAEAPVKVTDGKISLDTVPVNKGGTGVTTQADINKAFIGNLEVGSSDVTDGTEFVSSYASDNGFAETADGAFNKPYKIQFVKVWNYIKGKISSVLGLTKDNYGGTAATILDYVKGTPIKVRWGGDGINSADWYPAFNADGAALEPINKANIRAGKSDRTTGIEYTGESEGCISAQQTAESFNNSSDSWASYIICNHGNGKTYYHQMLRLPFFSDTIQLQRRVGGVLQGWKNVAIIENENTWSGRQNFDTAKASSKMVIPIGAPSSLEDGCIWIER